MFYMSLFSLSFLIIRLLVLSCCQSKLKIMRCSKWHCSAAFSSSAFPRLSKWEESWHAICKICWTFVAYILIRLCIFCHFCQHVSVFKINMLYCITYLFCFVLSFKLMHWEKASICKWCPSNQLHVLTIWHWIKTLRFYQIPSVYTIRKYQESRMYGYILLQYLFVSIKTCPMSRLDLRRLYGQGMWRLWIFAAGRINDAPQVAADDPREAQEMLIRVKSWGRRRSVQSCLVSSESHMGMKSRWEIKKIKDQHNPCFRKGNTIIWFFVRRTPKPKESKSLRFSTRWIGGSEPGIGVKNWPGNVRWCATKDILASHHLTKQERRHDMQKAWYYFYVLLQCCSRRREIVLDVLADKTLHIHLVWILRSATWYFLVKFLKVLSWIWMLSLNSFKNGDAFAAGQTSSHHR